MIEADSIDQPEQFRDGIQALGNTRDGLCAHSHSACSIYLGVNHIVHSHFTTCNFVFLSEFGEELVGGAEVEKFRTRTHTTSIPTCSKTFALHDARMPKPAAWQQRAKTT